jgi:hypothetical protein
MSEMDATMKIELLHVAGCPHLEKARRLLQSCLDDLGLRNIGFEEREGDFSSPTITVNGADVMGTSGTDTASCRLDLPTRERVIAALRGCAPARGSQTGTQHER